jgi:hypothetical protein
MRSTRQKKHTCPLCQLKNKREKRSNIVLQCPPKRAKLKTHELDIEAKQFLTDDEED